MPLFIRNSFRTPFGNQPILRSTSDVKTNTGMFAASTLPNSTIDGFMNQKILPKGVVLAKITSGPEIGKVGPYVNTAGTNEVQTLTKTGTWSAGTYTLSATVGTTTVTTDALAFDATAATIQAALRAKLVAAIQGFNGANVTVTGGPLSTTAIVVTFAGQGNVGAMAYDISLVTGSTPGLGVVETTAGVAGPTDGRQTNANIVGVNNTFLPWQITEGDREIAYIYEASLVQANCWEMNAAGVLISLTDTVAAFCFGRKSLDLKFF